MEILIAIIVVALLAFGIEYLFWSAYCYVVQGLFPEVHNLWTEPSFWFFWLATFVISALGRLVFGRSGK